MKLVYIYHSGFVIEGTGFSILIDYYRDTSHESGKGYVHEVWLKRPGRLYVLCSHVHADHYNPEILTWRQVRPDIHYILSKDIRSAIKESTENLVFLDKLDSFRDDLLELKAFGSTDAGISFLINAEGKRIFHAGDLNNWHWNEESSPEESRGYENAFLKELKILKEETDYVDLAMFPVDARLGKDYMKGATQFIEHIRTGCFAPMHFWEKYDKAAAFGEIARSRGCRFIAWTRPGESIDF